MTVVKKVWMCEESPWSEGVVYRGEGLNNDLSRLTERQAKLTQILSKHCIKIQWAWSSKAAGPAWCTKLGVVICAHAF